MSCKFVHSNIHQPAEAFDGLLMNVKARLSASILTTDSAREVRAKSVAFSSLSVASNRSAASGNPNSVAHLRLPYRAGIPLKSVMISAPSFGNAHDRFYAEKPQAGRKVVGSLLLGLYDADGLLHHVGFSSGIKARERVALTQKFEAIKRNQSFTGNAPGGPSRWSTKRSSEWQPVKSKYVVEVSYYHFTGGRFRHGTSILRWRPDKKPAQCTFEQVKQKINRKLVSNLGSGPINFLAERRLD